MAPVLIPVALSAATAAAGVGLGFVATGAAILSVAATAVAATASYLLAPSAGKSPLKNSAPSGPTSANESRSIAIAQATPPRRICYGPVRTGGAIFFQDNANPQLYIGTLLSDGPIEGIDQVYFGETPVPVDGSGAALTGSRWATRFSMETALGSSSQAVSASLLAAFPYFVDENFKQLGVARVVSQLHWGADATEHNKLWADGITPTFLIRGAKVYDPRDGTQSVGVPSSWKYSDNPALCIAHALISAWGVGLTTNDIDWSTVATAANACDVTTTYNGETVPLFRFSGVFQGDIDFGQQIADMLTSCRGAITYSAGLYGIVADGPRSSVWTVVDNDILELTEYAWGTESREFFTIGSARFYDIQNRGAQATTPLFDFFPGYPYARSTMIDLPFTPDSHSAQILVWRELKQSQDGRACVLRLTDPALWLAPGDVITLSLAGLAWMNGLYEVVQVDLADVGAIVTLRGYSADVYTNPTSYLV